MSTTLAILGKYIGSEVGYDAKLDVPFRTVIFRIVGKLDFRVMNPHATQPT
jgi:hypothetical protein